jgi:hypothetical protein
MSIMSSDSTAGAIEYNWRLFANFSTKTTQLPLLAHIIISTNVAAMWTHSLDGSSTDEIQCGAPSYIWQ